MLTFSLSFDTSRFGDCGRLAFYPFKKTCRYDLSLLEENNNTPSKKQSHSKVSQSLDVGLRLAPAVHASSPKGIKKHSEVHLDPPGVDNTARKKKKKSAACVRLEDSRVTVKLPLIP